MIAGAVTEDIDTFSSWEVVLLIEIVFVADSLAPIAKLP